MSDIQAETDLFFVRERMVEQEPPPTRNIGVLGWLRANLFATVPDTILTILGALFVIWIVPPIISWALVHAQWTGADRSACAANTAGACWAYVRDNLGQFIYGRYPQAQRWRVDLFFLLIAAGIVPMAIPSAPYKRLNTLYLMAGIPVISFFLLTGAFPGLSRVDTQLWGGLMLTIVVSIVGMVVALPLGIVLALGRRSRMPAVRIVSVVFIEVWRGVPLITVLFMASVMLPLFLPPGIDFNKLLRALIGVALFSAAYMAEIVRGGLQAVPKGQYEGAMALGLGYWPMMRLVVLPQALKIVIPGIVNNFIGLFKDTSLVYIIGLFELLGTVRQSFANPEWATSQTPATGLVFAALIFWIFCFAMSRYSLSIERRLHTGHRR